MTSLAYQILSQPRNGSRYFYHDSFPPYAKNRTREDSPQRESMKAFVPLSPFLSLSHTYGDGSNDHRNNNLRASSSGGCAISFFPCRSICLFRVETKADTNNRGREFEPHRSVEPVPHNGTFHGQFRLGANFPISPRLRYLRT
mgnify:CR=1 FL=1